VLPCLLPPDFCRRPPRNYFLDLELSGDDAREGTHEIKEYRMVHQIILSRFHIWRRGKVHPKVLAYLFDFVPSPRQPNYFRMKFSYQRGVFCDGHVPARYFFNDAGSSRFGSQVMNKGCNTGFCPSSFTTSIIPAILSNSSGQISGHRVNPK